MKKNTDRNTDPFIYLDDGKPVKTTFRGMITTFMIRHWHKRNRKKYDAYVDTVGEFVYVEILKAATELGIPYASMLPESKSGQIFSARDIAEAFAEMVAYGDMNTDQANSSMAFVMECIKAGAFVK